MELKGKGRKKKNEKRLKNLKKNNRSVDRQKKMLEHEIDVESRSRLMVSFLKSFKGCRLNEIWR